MLRRKPGVTSTLDGVDLKLLEGVDAGLTWSALLKSLTCEADEAAMRVLRLIQQGHLEGKPGEDCARPAPSSVHTVATVPPSAPASTPTRPLHSAVTVAPSASSSVPTAAMRAPTSLASAPASASAATLPPRAPSAPAPSRSDSKPNFFDGKPTIPDGKTLPPTAVAAREALLRELALRRTSTYPPARPSQPGSGPVSSKPPPGYYSVRPSEESAGVGSSVPPGARSSVPARIINSSVPPGRYSVQPDARSNSSSPPGGLHGNFDSALITLMDELSNGSDVQRWSAARLREALEQDAAGQIQQAIATLQAVMAQLSDPRIRVERDRLLARSLKATSGVYRARALTAERACQHKEAAASWSKVLEASPDDSEAAIHAATCSMEAGEISQAGVFARRAVELEPKSVTAHRLLLRFFRKTGMELNANREREILRQLAPKG